MVRAYPDDVPAGSEERRVDIGSEIEDEESFLRATRLGLTLGWPTICAGERLPDAGDRAPPAWEPEAPDADAWAPPAGERDEEEALLELDEEDPEVLEEDDPAAVEEDFVVAEAATDDAEAVEDFAAA